MLYFFFFKRQLDESDVKLDSICLEMIQTQAWISIFFPSAASGRVLWSFDSSASDAPG